MEYTSNNKKGVAQNRLANFKQQIIQKNGVEEDLVKFN